jgi:hypothetical protein
VCKDIFIKGITSKMNLKKTDFLENSNQDYLKNVHVMNLLNIK